MSITGIWDIFTRLKTVSAQYRFRYIPKQNTVYDHWSTSGLTVILNKSHIEATVGEHGITGITETNSRYSLGITKNNEPVI